MRLLVLLAFVAVSSILVPAYADGLPSWVKQIAIHWGNGDTTDAEFSAAIEYLLKKGIINLDPGILPTFHDGTGGLPYGLSTVLFTSESGGLCSGAITGINIDPSRGPARYGLEIDVRSNMPSDTCRIANHVQGIEGTVAMGIGAILLDHANYEEKTLLYSQWYPREDSPGLWILESDPESRIKAGPYDHTWDEIDSLTVIYYDYDGVFADEAGTIFFENIRRHSVTLDLEESDITLVP